MTKILFVSLLFFASIGICAEKTAQKKQQPEKDTSGFQTEDSYIDYNEAIKSRQYVRRAILSSVVKDSSHFSLGRPYINHLMGFNAIIHRGGQVFTKYVSGVQGLSVGYALENGLAFEAGAEFSALSDAFAGIRYIHRLEKFSLWPFVGCGGGTTIGSMNIADGPPEAKYYTGPEQMGFLTLGVLVPVVDVGIKAEARGIFYGMTRLSLIAGIGVIIFL